MRKLDLFYGKVNNYAEVDNNNDEQETWDDDHGVSNAQDSTGQMEDLAYSLRFFPSQEDSLLGTGAYDRQLA
jgi:hypothetical protein